MLATFQSHISMGKCVKRKPTCHIVSPRTQSTMTYSQWRYKMLQIYTNTNIQYLYLHELQVHGGTDPAEGLY